MYCGTCDGSQILKPLDRRRICRATWVSGCGNPDCPVKGLPTPQCQRCAFSRVCPKCGKNSWYPHPLRNFSALDSDTDEDCPDIRVHPPRFTPWSRTFGRNWILGSDGWHRENPCLKGFCTGCDMKSGIRCPVRVVLIDSIGSGMSVRYLHMLCGRCVRCVTERVQDINTAGCYGTLGGSCMMILDWPKQLSSERLIFGRAAS